ncbi:hypothetical protein [Vibrio phage PJN101]|nr:hypothetical protein [Vibrio phage PJN101]
MVEQIQSMIAHGVSKADILAYLRKEYGTEDVNIEELLHG